MLEAIPHDEVLELRLARPPVNALDPGLIARLREAILAAPAQGARAIVLSGAPGLYSAGLDVPALLGRDRAAMREFWRDFIGLIGALGRCPVPTAAAITGHSPAGGAVLSLYCDYRVMAAGPYRIGLNEVQVGLFVPEGIQYALKRLVGAHRAERLMVAGAMIEAGEAQRVGLVDELAEPAEVVPRALAFCRSLTALPPLAMAATRRIARADLHAALDEAERASDEGFVDAWFGEETQRTLHALVARLKSKG